MGPWVQVEGQLLGIDDSAWLDILGVGLASALAQLDLRRIGCIFEGELQLLSALKTGIR